MLVIGSSLMESPLLSFQVGGNIANLQRAIIYPEELSVLGYEVSGPEIDNDPEIGSILDVRDIREYSKLGIVIDSAEKLVNPEDVIKIKDTLELDFDLVGLKVTSEDGKKLGKVSDYTVDTNTWSIYQIIVQRPFTKSFIEPELTINRSQITFIDDFHIEVKNDKEKVEIKEEEAEFVPNYDNPFRQKRLAEQENSIRDAEKAGLSMKLRKDDKKEADAKKPDQKQRAEDEDTQ